MDHPKIPQNLKKMVSTKIVHTSGTFLEFVLKRCQKVFKLMFPYRVKYTESEYDIHNNDLLYKLHQRCQNTFEMLEKLEMFENFNFFLLL